MKQRFRVWHVCCHTLQFWVMSWNYAHIWLTGSRQNTYFCLCTRKHSVILPCLNILVADYCIKSKYSHLCAIRNIAFKIYYYSFQRRLWGCANGKALHGCTAMLITIILVTIRNYLTWYFFLRWCTDWLKRSGHIQIGYQLHEHSKICRGLSRQLKIFTCNSGIPLLSSTQVNSQFDAQSSLQFPTIMRLYVNICQYICSCFMVAHNFFRLSSLCQ